jgi:RNA polymerase sigma factor (sigma-70 family)
MNRHRLSDPLLRVQADERLAALAAHGGERAFAVLVERHRPALLGFARRLGCAAAAEDVVQQALLQAWTALGRGSQVEHVGAWLHRIVRNAAIRAAANAPGPAAELPATLVAATATADEVEMRQRTRDLLREIERLPPRQREALLRLAVDGSSGAEAGREMQLEANAVRQLAHRARMRLRTAMGAAVPWPLALWAARGFGAGGLRAIDGVPELVGGSVAGAAGTTAGAGLLKLGAIATTTAAVAVGAVGLGPQHRDRAHASAPSAQSLAARERPNTAEGTSHRDAGAGSHARARAVLPVPHGERLSLAVAPTAARTAPASGGTRHDGGGGGDGGTRHDGRSGAGSGRDGGTSGGDGSGSGGRSQGGDGSSGDSPTAAQPASADGSGDGGSQPSGGGGDSHDGSGSGSGDGGSLTTTTATSDGGRDGGMDSGGGSGGSGTSGG